MTNTELTVGEATFHKCSNLRAYCLNGSRNGVWIVRSNRRFQDINFTGQNIIHLLFQFIWCAPNGLETQKRSYGGMLLNPRIGGRISGAICECIDRWICVSAWMYEYKWMDLKGRMGAEPKGYADKHNRNGVLNSLTLIR